MRERVAEKMGVPMVVVVAAAVIALYSFWGASIVQEREGNSIFSGSHETLSANI